MSKPSDVEVRATTFVRDNRDLLEDAGPLTLQTIARAGSLIAVELCDEVVESAEAYEKALYEGSDAIVGSESGKDLNPRRVAAVESRIPTLKDTYERKSRAFEELTRLTQRAIARCEAAEGYAEMAQHDWALNEEFKYVDSETPWPEYEYTPLEILDEEPEPASWDIFQKMAESPPRKRGFWSKLFGRERS